MAITARQLALVSLAVFLFACGDDTAGNLDLPGDQPGIAGTNDGNGGTLDAGPNDSGGNDAGQDSAPSVTDPILNEYVVDNMGVDTNEYIEIFGDPSTDYSDYTVLQINDNGDILFSEEVATTNAAGYWVTALPSDSSLQNGDTSILLVDSYVAPGDDDLDTNDDGTLDVTPWTAVIDAVGCDQNIDDTDRFYLEGEGVIVTRNDANQGGASRVPDGTDADEGTPNWVPNDLTGTAGDDTEADNTPGAENALGPVE